MTHKPLTPRVTAILTVVLALAASTSVYAREAPHKTRTTRDDTLATPAWKKPYTGDAATGKDVVALWHFDQPQPTRDASGHGHALTVRKNHTQVTASGRFDGGLTLATGENVAKHGGGATAAKSADFTPKGPFTVEMWIQPSPGLASRSRAFLIDTKGFAYASKRDDANQGYLLLLRRTGKKFRLEAQLGFGKQTQTIKSPPMDFPAGQWRHVALTYDGHGNARLYVGDKRVAQSQWKTRGSIAPATHDLAIGDRTIGAYHRFVGTIDEVRLSHGTHTFHVGQVSLEHVDGTRTVFHRLEEPAALHLRTVNDTSRTIEDATVTFEGEIAGGKPVHLPALSPGQQVDLAIPLDTSLSAGSYSLTARIRSGGGNPLSKKAPLEVDLIARSLPHRMPVVIWTHSDPPVSLDHMRRIGFNYVLIGGWRNPLIPRHGQKGRWTYIWKQQKPGKAGDSGDVITLRNRLDHMMKIGLNGAAYLSPGRRVAQHWKAMDAKKYLRVDREGKTYKRKNVCGLFQRVEQFAYNVGAFVGKTYGDMPALKAAMIGTETRGSAKLCFHDKDRRDYRAASGRSIPEAARDKRGVRYQNLSGFPRDRVVADDNPLLTYYRWYWKQGNGWNGLYSSTAQGLKDSDGGRLWTWHDPAVRVASVYGSGGKVDFLSQWTYTNPNPLKIALATDELFAMAGGRPNQQVMTMCQLIWYRRDTAPKGDHVKHPAPWEKEQPDAFYITIPPDMVREALWMELSRPVKGIMYHGWGSLVKTPPEVDKLYNYTNPQTHKTLRHLLHDVVTPLSPALLQVPAQPSDVAYLESFASQMFAGRGAYGWGTGWGADGYVVARYAQLQPHVVYDQTIRENKLKNDHVLILFDCDVLCQSVVNVIHDFQGRGGIVVGDENLTPAVSPDILIPRYSRTHKAGKDKAAILQRAARLARRLEPYYKPYVESPDAQVILRRRRAGEADYVFAVNDHRTFGRYLGQHGRVMAVGTPIKATLTVDRGDGFVYALPEGGRVHTRAAAGRLSFDATLDGGQGKLFMVLPRKIHAVRIDAPDHASPGARLTCRVRIVNADGKPIQAVLPVEMRITNSRGELAEYSGYEGAKDGELQRKLNVPTNAHPGTWHIQVTDLASGKTTTHPLKITSD